MNDDLREKIYSLVEEWRQYGETPDEFGTPPDINELMTLIDTNGTKREKLGETRGRLIQSEAMLSRLNDGADMKVLLEGQVDAWEYDLGVYRELLLTPTDLDNSNNSNKETS